MRALLAAFARLGHDVPPLLQAAGVRANDLDDPDLRVPCEAVARLYAAAQQRRPIANLDLRLAIETPLGAYPVLDYLIVTSGSVAEGMRRFARHSALVGAPLEVELHEDASPIRVAIEGSPFGVFLAAFHLRREVAGTFRPEYVSLRERPDDPGAVERELGCPLRSPAPWSGLALSREAWALPFKRRDPVLQEILERHASHLLEGLPRADDVVSELRRVLARRVAQGDSRLSAVARDLATSVRTLQRRLNAAGVSYQEVLEQTRCDAAECHLAEGSLSIAELSWLLGYSEPSAFHRAFKRWRGLSPRAYRERHARAIR